MRVGFYKILDDPDQLKPGDIFSFCVAGDNSRQFMALSMNEARPDKLGCFKWGQTVADKAIWMNPTGLFLRPANELIRCPACLKILIEGRWQTPPKCFNVAESVIVKERICEGCLTTRPAPV